ncbi:hypothetical protein [Phaeocystidibacter luteus]|uniref:Tfp pilus assembly protein, major pilin PilA n=1 Tax=Phaeocystidibacter luteus TaxID=911197 RepID=A0A6N6RF66_9FLAO|nr:hypothetical protein [Phaeocystidibacter luteus]KAB2807719.1 hypothetical protein F8C67_11810 [Phaeocystidibacter luteus]
MLRSTILRSSVTLLFASTTLLLTSSCAKSGDQVITHENGFSLTIPASMRESSDLNEDASLQYENMFDDIYVIVIEDTKEEMEAALSENDLLDLYPNTLEGFTDLISESLVSSLSNVNQSPILDTTINSLDARIMTISGTYLDIDGYYYLGLFEGSDRYYQVMTWTSLDNKAEHTAKMKNMVYSMTEI